MRPHPLETAMIVPIHRRPDMVECLRGPPHRLWMEESYSY